MGILFIWMAGGERYRERCGRQWEVQLPSHSTNAFNIWGCARLKPNAGAPSGPLTWVWGFCYLQLSPAASQGEHQQECYSGSDIGSGPKLESRHLDMGCRYPQAAPSSLNQMLTFISCLVGRSHKFDGWCSLSWIILHLIGFVNFQFACIYLDYYFGFNSTYLNGICFKKSWKLSMTYQNLML